MWHTRGCQGLISLVKISTIYSAPPTSLMSSKYHWIFPNLTFVLNIIITPQSIKGVGNVTNLQTWTDLVHATSRINYGVDQGVITTADGQDMATCIGYGVGRSNTNGTIT